MATRKTAGEMVRDAFERARGRTSLVRYAGRVAGAAEYIVSSQSDVDAAYTVRVARSQFTCDCPSGHRAACWHRAAVQVVRAGRLAHGLPADGLTAQQMVIQDRAAARMREIAALFAA